MVPETRHANKNGIDIKSPDLKFGVGYSIKLGHSGATEQERGNFVQDFKAVYINIMGGVQKVQIWNMW